MDKFTFYDLRKGTSSVDIDVLFPDWKAKQECVAVFGAHDDDPLLGAGYAIAAALENSAEVFIVIFCQGDCGYSDPGQKGSIVETRRKENENAMVRFGIKKENIIRFEYPDLSLGNFKGKQTINGDAGAFMRILDLIRNNGITRALIPNGYREHSDHTAAYDICAEDIIQCGDPINKRIENLIEQRRNRQSTAGFIELYIDLDPRPKLVYAPYIILIEEISKRGVC